MVPEGLTAYLEYMKSLQFNGLQLSHNPFLQGNKTPEIQPTRNHRPVQAPQIARPPMQQSLPADPPKLSKNEPAARAILSLVDMVDLVSPEQGNRAKAEAIQGSSSGEILHKLYRAFCDCEACPLGTTRTKFVFGEGPADAELMFIGEGPGYDEDISGRPFVGSAGQLLDKIIEAMGFRRDQVFIANVVKCRPPGNRTPLPDEMAACSPILRRQIEAVNPRSIVVLGSTALKFLPVPMPPLPECEVVLSIGRTDVSCPPSTRPISCETPVRNARFGRILKAVIADLKAGLST